MKEHYCIGEGCWECKKAQQNTTVSESPSVTGWGAFREKVKKWYVKYFVAYAFILGWYVGAVCMLIYFAYTTKLGAECFH